MYLSCVIMISNLLPKTLHNSLYNYSFISFKKSVRRPGFPSRAGAETSEAAIVMKKLLSTYKQKCKEGGGDPGQELIKAMEKQLDGENIMNKVVFLHFCLYMITGQNQSSR